MKKRIALTLGVAAMMAAAPVAPARADTTLKVNIWPNINVAFREALEASAPGSRT